MSVIDEKDINNVKKMVFLALKKDIDRTIDSEVKKILLAKKKAQDEHQISYL